MRPLVLALLLPQLALASVFQLDGDRVTMVEENEPLSSVLRHFVHAGVRVHIDPESDPRVSAHAVDRPVEDVVEQLVQPLGYAVIWEVVRGPVGALPRLAEIRVFREGREDAARPLDDNGGNLQVAENPVAGGAPYVADEALIRLRPGTSAEDFRRLLSQLGGTILSSVPELGIYQIRFPPGTNIPALIAQLAQNSLVESAEPNYVTRLPAPQRVSDDARTSRPPTLREDAARVAVLDSGLLPETALGDAVVGRYDAMDPARALVDPAGHGTQMALIASGAIAPAGGTRSEGVPVLAIRAFDDNGYTSNFALMRAMSYALSQGARVVNMSWGTNTRSAFIAEAIAYAQNRGLVVVASAGNEASGQPVYPAAYPGVLAVSAMNPDGTLWEGSNFGSTIALAAPGRASFPVGHRGPPGAYAGTSIASAYTARQLALYFSRHPQATSQQALRALQQALSDQGARGPDPYYGNGALDAAALGRFLSTP